MKEKNAALFYLSTMPPIPKCLENAGLFILNVLQSSWQLVLGTSKSFWDPQSCKTMKIVPWIMSLPGSTLVPGIHILGYLLKCMLAVSCKD